MAWCLLGTKPLSETMLVSSKLTSWGQIWKWELRIHFSLKHEFENFLCKGPAILFLSQCVNSLWLYNAIWHYRTRSLSVQVISCCLTAPSRYLNNSLTNHQWDLVTIARQQFHMRYLWHQLSKLASKLLQEISIMTPRGQWVKACCIVNLMPTLGRHQGGSKSLGVSLLSP